MFLKLAMLLGIIAELQCAKRASGAPKERNFGKPMKPRNFGSHMSVRASERPYRLWGRVGGFTGQLDTGEKYVILCCLISSKNDIGHPCCGQY